MEAVADYVGFSWWDDDLRWGIRGFFHNGNYCYSNGTIIAVSVTLGEERRAYLIDTAKLEENADGGTIITDAAMLFEGEYMGIDENDFWLAKQNGQWGYIDHDGNVMAMFDSATRFSNGKAMVMKDGYACFVDENMTPGEWKIQAENIDGYGEVYVVETPQGQKCFTTAVNEN